MSNSNIDVSKLHPRWIHVVTSETTWPSIPAYGEGHIVQLNGEWTPHRAFDRDSCTAWRSVDPNTGNTGPVISRSTPTRWWSVVPPNTTEKIALRYTDDEVHWRMGTDVQTPSETHLAWMPWSDWLAFLAAPSVAPAASSSTTAPERVRLFPVTFTDGEWVWDKNIRRETNIPYATAVEYVRADLLAAPRVVEVTAEELLTALVDAGVAVSRISTEALAEVAQTLNERRARATTAPRSLAWLTGERLFSEVEDSSNWHVIDSETKRLYNDAAARLRQLGEAP